MIYFYTPLPCTIQIYIFISIWISVINNNNNHYYYSLPLLGETNLKLRKALDVTSAAVETSEIIRIQGFVQSESPNERLYQFNGRLVLVNQEKGERSIYPLDHNQLLQRVSLSPPFSFLLSTHQIIPLFRSSFPPFSNCFSFLMLCTYVWLTITKGSSTIEYRMGERNRSLRGSRYQIVSQSTATPIQIQYSRTSAQQVYIGNISISNAHLFD